MYLSDFLFVTSKKKKTLVPPVPVAKVFTKGIRLGANDETRSNKLLSLSPTLMSVMFCSVTGHYRKCIPRFLRNVLLSRQLMYS